MDNLDQLQTDLLAEVEAADLAALEALRVSALGKSGSITEMVKGIGQLPADERRDAGQKLNAVKNAVSDAIDSRKEMLEAAALDASLAEDRIDVTLPARPEAAAPAFNSSAHKADSTRPQTSTRSIHAVQASDWNRVTSQSDCLDKVGA